MTTNSHRTFLASIAFTVFAVTTHAQVQNLVLEKDLHRGYEAPVFRDVNGVRYSALIKVNFQDETFQLVSKSERFDWSNAPFKSSRVKETFEETRRHFGNFEVEFRYPTYRYGKNLRWNKRSKSFVEVPDLSQVFAFHFEKVVPIDSVVAFLTSQQSVVWACGPMIAETSDTPNDPYFSQSYQWYLYRDNAPAAWNITKGVPGVKIDINDRWGTDSPPITQKHLDIGSKIVQEFGSVGLYGDHGTLVAGVAGALTNNQFGIASIGWQVSLTKSNYLSPQQITAAANSGVDVINMSWHSENPELRPVIGTALLQGVVVVAAAGNKICCPNDPHPHVEHPAAYHFGGDTGQVIAVSGTRLNPFPSGPEEFITYIDGDGTEWYNFSPGTDPLNDPENSFVDVAAPGAEITTTANYDYIDVNRIWGTSLSAPQVSALAGLILSLNNSLTPIQVYNIITTTADKIGQFPYTNGWNRYMGYGRINAYNALKYTLEHYGGTITQNLTIPSGESWNIQPGVTWQFASGTSLTVNGTLNAQGTSSSPIFFTSATGTTPGSWYGVSVQGSTSIFKWCTFQYGTIALNLSNNSGNQIPVEYCTFRYNSYCGLSIGAYGRAKVDSCDIYGNTGAGMGLLCNTYGGNIDLVGNWIHNNTGRGINSYYSNVVQLFGNVIEYNGAEGIFTAFSDIIRIGRVYGWWGYNTIRENGGDEVYNSQYYSSVELSGASVHDDAGWEIYNYPGNPTINAQSVYWNTDGPQTSGSVNLMPSVYWSLPDWDGQRRTAGSPIGKMSAPLLTDEDEWILDPNISDAEKVKRCKEIIAKDPKSDEANTALIWLYAILRSDYEQNTLGEKEGFFGYLQDIHNSSVGSPTEKSALQYMVIWKMMEKGFATVIQLSNEALKQATGRERKWLLASVVPAYAYSGQTEAAKNTLKELKQN
jgi:thermitase